MLTVDPEINLAVAHLFNEAQVHCASHRKNIQALRRLHHACSTSLAREQQFFLSLLSPLNVILGATRKNSSQESVNRSLRFFVGFILYSAEHDQDGMVMGGGESTPIVRLIENLMLYAAEGLDARDRLVRARLAQVMVACVNAVDELSEPVWEVFRVKMTERLFDRESVVRVHAVHAMARLQSLPIDNELTVGDILTNLLQHDPAVEVRRACLQHLDFTEHPDRLPAILSRARDVDPAVRRMFFSRRMRDLDPRQLDVEQRDGLLRAGLSDRYTD